MDNKADMVWVVNSANLHLPPTIQRPKLLMVDCWSNMHCIFCCQHIFVLAHRSTHKYCLPTHIQHALSIIPEKILDSSEEERARLPAQADKSMPSSSPQHAIRHNHMRTQAKNQTAKPFANIKKSGYEWDWFSIFRFSVEMPILNNFFPFSRFYFLQFFSSIFDVLKKYRHPYTQP